MAWLFREYQESSRWLKSARALSDPHPHPGSERVKYGEIITFFQKYSASGQGLIPQPSLQSFPARSHTQNELLYNDSCDVCDCRLCFILSPSILLHSRKKTFHFLVKTPTKRRQTKRFVYCGRWSAYELGMLRQCLDQNPTFGWSGSSISEVFDCRFPSGGVCSQPNVLPHKSQTRYHQAVLQ